MTISVFSVIMSIICSSLVLLTGSLLIKYGKKVRWEFIGLMFVLGFLRLCLPLEMRGMRLIDDWRVYPIVWRLFVDQHILGIPLYVVAVGVWVIGGGLCLLQFLYKMCLLRRILDRSTMISPSDRVYELCQQVASQIHCKQDMKVAVTSEISIPLSAGVLSPVILIPEQMLDFSELEFEGIVKHELTHYLRGDVAKQRGLNLLQCVFWWNPVLYHLKKTVEQMLELQCDAKVCEDMTEEEKLIYLDGIMRVLKLGKRKDRSLGIGYAKDNTAKFLERRFYEVIYPTEKHSWGATLTLTAVCVALFCTSYLFIVQPAALPPESELWDTRETLEQEEVTEFLLRLSDGTYMYMKDMIGVEILTEEQIQKSPYRELPIFDSY